MIVIPNRVRVVVVIAALALAGRLLTLALLPKPTQARAVSQQFPQNFRIDDTDCVGGEVIDVTGTLYTVENSVPVQGGYHVNSQYNFKGTGVGLDKYGEPNGNKYVITSNSVSVENFVPSGDFVHGNVDLHLEIGKGSLPNRESIATLHYIVDAEGTEKMLIAQVRSGCPGGETVPPTATATATAAPTATAKAQSRP